MHVYANLQDVQCVSFISIHLNPESETRKVRAHFRKFETRSKDGETEDERAEALLQGLDSLARI